jgi:protein-tyrosine phosphatase
MKILMTCLGNICRSPMAEGILQQMADDTGLDWQVHSSGTNGLHTGEPPHKSSQKVCSEHGYDITNQRSADFKASDFETYDKIYVMAADVMRDVKQIAGNKFNADKIDYFLNELYPGKNQDVIDPWYGGEDGYYDVFNQIEECCKAILARYR